MFLPTSTGVRLFNSSSHPLPKKPAKFKKLSEPSNDKSYFRDSRIPDDDFQRQMIKTYRDSTLSQMERDRAFTSLFNAYKKFLNHLVYKRISLLEFNPNEAVQFQSNVFSIVKVAFTKAIINMDISENSYQLESPSKTITQFVSIELYNELDNQIILSNKEPIYQTKDFRITQDNYRKTGEIPEGCIKRTKNLLRYYSTNRIKVNIDDVSESNESMKFLPEFFNSNDLITLRALIKECLDEKEFALFRAYMPIIDGQPHEVVNFSKVGRKFKLQRHQSRAILISAVFKITNHLKANGLHQEFGITKVA